MPSGLQFIYANPATQAMREGERRSEQRRAADLAATRGERDMQWENNVDTAIRGGMAEDRMAALPAAAQPMPAPAPQPGAGPGVGMDVHAQGNLQSEMTQTGMTPPTVPQPQPRQQGAPNQSFGGQRVGDAVASRLATVPGGGRLALQQRQQGEQQREAQITNIIHLLSSPATAHLGMAQAQRIGMTIPQELAQNTNFWQGTAIAKQLYPDDPGAGQRFTTAFVQTQAPDIQSRVQAAVQSAGAPVKKRRFGVAQGDNGIVFYNLENPADQMAGPQHTTGQYVTAEGGAMHFVPRGQTQAQAITGPDGLPLKAQRFGTRLGAGNTSVYQQKHQTWLAVHPGDEAGALRYAAGQTVLNDVELQNRASQMAAREMQGSFAEPEQKAARVQELYQVLRELNGAAAPGLTPSAPSAAPAGAPQPQAAQPGGHPTPQTQQDWDALPSGTIYTDPDDQQTYQKP